MLGGLALAFSRLIDNSVVVLENIYRHLELGEPPEYAARGTGAVLQARNLPLKTINTIRGATNLQRSGAMKQLTGLSFPRQLSLPVNPVSRRQEN